jgi:hypothetical protein
MRREGADVVTEQLLARAAIASAAANITLVALITGLAAIIHRQGTKLVRAHDAITDLVVEKQGLSVEMDIQFNEIRRLMEINDGLDADLQELRDENVSLLRNMVTGEAS